MMNHYFSAITRCMGHKWNEEQRQTYKDYVQKKTEKLLDLNSAFYIEPVKIGATFLFLVFICILYNVDFVPSRYSSFDTKLYYPLTLVRNKDVLTTSKLSTMKKHKLALCIEYHNGDENSLKLKVLELLQKFNTSLELRYVTLDLIDQILQVYRYDKGYRPIFWNQMYVKYTFISYLETKIWNRLPSSKDHLFIRLKNYIFFTGYLIKRYIIFCFVSFLEKPALLVYFSKMIQHWVLSKMGLSYAYVTIKSRTQRVKKLAYNMILFAFELLYLYNVVMLELKIGHQIEILTKSDPVVDPSKVSYFKRIVIGIQTGVKKLNIPFIIANLTTFYWVIDKLERIGILKTVVLPQNRLQNSWKSEEATKNAIIRSILNTYRTQNLALNWSIERKNKKLLNKISKKNSDYTCDYLFYTNSTNSTLTSAVTQLTLRPGLKNVITAVSYMLLYGVWEKSISPKIDELLIDVDLRYEEVKKELQKKSKKTNECDKEMELKLLKDQAQELKLYLKQSLIHEVWLVMLRFFFAEITLAALDFVVPITLHKPDFVFELGVSQIGGLIYLGLKNSYGSFLTWIKSIRSKLFNTTEIIQINN